MTRLIPTKRTHCKKQFNPQNRSGDQFTSRWTIFLHMMTHSQTAEKTVRVKVTNRCEEHPGLPILLFLYLRARKKHFSPQPWCFTETPISHNHFVPNSSFGLTSPLFYSSAWRGQRHKHSVPVWQSYFLFFFFRVSLSQCVSAGIVKKENNKSKKREKKGAEKPREQTMWCCRRRQNWVDCSGKSGRGKYEATLIIYCLLFKQVPKVGALQLWDLLFYLV